MRYGLIFWAVIVLALSAAPARAQDLDGTPYAYCPGYEKDNELVRQLAWSVGCVLQGIYDGNKELVEAFTDAGGCVAAGSCYGMDDYEWEFIFGIGNSGEVTSGADAVATILRKAKSASIVLSHPLQFLSSQKRIEVMIIPRPGKDKTKVCQGWASEYFICTYSFDETLGIWLNPGFCAFDTDSYTGGSGGDIVVDLTGRSSALPVIVWTPKTVATNYPFFKGSPPHYINSTFGLDVAAPAGLHLCASDSGTMMSHGVWIPLSDSEGCSLALRQKPFINVYVGFETTHKAESADNLADAVCGSAKLPPTAFPDIGIPDHLGAACQGTYVERDSAGKINSGNRIDTKVFALADSLWRIKMELRVSLVTTGEPQPDDLARMTQLLDRIKFKPPN